MWAFNPSKVGPRSWVIKKLPMHVSKIFYKGETEMWTNDSGIAFGESKPHNVHEIKLALEWFVHHLGGRISWSKGGDL